MLSQISWRMRSGVFRLWNSKKLAPRRYSAATTEPSSSIDKDDVARHANLASQWWDPYGPFLALHSLNEVRVPFIRDGLIATDKVNPEHINTTRVLDGVNILEVGCGGGILTEAIARLHGKVVGIDPGEDVIQTAKEHLQNFSSELKDFINYKIEPIEVHTQNNENKYDAVIISEVIEHVKNKEDFLSACVNTLKPGGSIFITTFDKTLFSLLGPVLIAENILKIIPKGTHDWNNFIRPIEAQRILEGLNCSTILVNGFFYEFWRNSWKWLPTTSSSYVLQAVKHE